MNFKRGSFNKKGISDVVTTVLLILLVMGAIAGVWFVVNNFINTNTSEIGSSTVCFTNQLSIELANYSSGPVPPLVGDRGVTAIKVKRIGSGNDPIEGISF